MIFSYPDVFNQSKLQPYRQRLCPQYDSIAAPMPSFIWYALAGIKKDGRYCFYRCQLQAAAYSKISIQKISIKKTVGQYGNR